MMGEFDLISRYFTRHNGSIREDVLQSVGDDCAVLCVPSDQQIAISTDTLVCGTHFLPNIDPADLAHKTVAVNLSDLAAMGAKPAWVSLALTLPEIDHPWLEKFSQSLFGILDRYQVNLIGGDTTKGHLSLTLTVQGLLSKGSGLFRHKAKIGDKIYVSGNLGDSAAGLKLLLDQVEIENADQRYLLQRHLRPTPRTELGQLLTQFSQCAIDISDGLLADLGHILKASQCGAEIYLEKLPLSSALRNEFDLTAAEQFALTGGEDYELCFTISPENQLAFEQAVAKLDVHCHCIGTITASGVQLVRHHNVVPLPTQIGFDHFR